jgi:ATP-dependent protease ClpP protease subunit
MSQKLLFPIMGRIENSKINDLEEILKIIGPGDELHSYVSSFGGDANVMSQLVGTIIKLPIKTFVYAGNDVCSGAVMTFLAFNERIAFEDSKFFIHECIPPKDHPRTKVFEEFDLQVWNFMIERMQKISLDELMIIVKKGKYFSARKAFEIGMVDKIIEGQASFLRWKELIG